VTLILFAADAANNKTHFSQHNCTTFKLGIVRKSSEELLSFHTNACPQLAATTLPPLLKTFSPCYNVVITVGLVLLLAAAIILLVLLRPKHRYNKL
jgi:hypothetical protein